MRSRPQVRWSRGCRSQSGLSPQPRSNSPPDGTAERSRQRVKFDRLAPVLAAFEIDQQEQIAARRPGRRALAFERPAGKDGVVTRVLFVATAYRHCVALAHVAVPAFIQ